MSQRVKSQPWSGGGNVPLAHKVRISGTQDTFAHLGRVRKPSVGGAGEQGWLETFLYRQRWMIEHGAPCPPS